LVVILDLLVDASKPLTHEEFADRAYERDRFRAA